MYVNPFFLSVKRMIQRNLSHDSYVSFDEILPNKKSEQRALPITQMPLSTLLWHCNLFLTVSTGSNLQMSAAQQRRCTAPAFIGIHYVWFHNFFSYLSEGFFALFYSVAEIQRMHLILAFLLVHQSLCLSFLLICFYALN